MVVGGRPFKENDNTDVAWDKNEFDTSSPQAAQSVSDRENSVL